MHYYTKRKILATTELESRFLVRVLARLELESIFLFCLSDILTSPVQNFSFTGFPVYLRT